MNKIVYKLIFLWIPLSIFVCFGSCKVYAEELLEMMITTEDGRLILAKDDGLIYSSVALCFEPEITSQAERMEQEELMEQAEGKGYFYYRLSTDKGESFGGEVLVEDNRLVLYPDDSMSDDNTFVICFIYEFASLNDDGEVVINKLTSRNYSVKFDLNSPRISAINEEILADWVRGDESLEIHTEDEDGLICRIVAYDNDEVIYEERFSEDDEQYDKDFSIPLQSEGEDNVVKIVVYDFASNVSCVEYPYCRDNSAPMLTLNTPADLGNDRTASISIYDNCITSTNCVYELTREYGGVVTIDAVDICCGDNNGVINIETEGEGKYTLTAYAYDMAGNRSSEENAVWLIDNSAPGITMGGVENNALCSGPVDLSIRVTDMLYENCNVSVTAVRKKQDNQENLPLESFYMCAPTEERIISLKNEGDYTVYVKAADAAGNESDGFISFRIDKKPPALYLEGINEGEVTSSIPTIKMKMHETFYDTASVQMDLFKKDNDGILVTKKSMEYSMKDADDELDFEVPEEGEYELTCMARDQAGNKVIRSLSFMVDTTAPVINGVEEMDGQYYKSYELPKNIGAFVDDATEVVVDAFINDRTLPGNEKLSSDGRYVLWVGATDEAGNFAEKSAEFTIDRTKPQILLKGIKSNGNIKKGKEVEVSLLNKQDVLNEVLLNGQNVKINNDSTARLRIEDYGDYSIEVKASDRAGNETDKMIYASCVKGQSYKDEYEKINKVMAKNSVLDFSYEPVTEEGVDYKSILIGVIMMVGATMILAYRAVCLRTDN